jgi:hypothetical protein
MENIGAAKKGEIKVAEIDSTVHEDGRRHNGRKPGVPNQQQPRPERLIKY